MALTQISTQGIKDGTISSADLADQSVTLAKLPHGTSSNNGKFLRANNGADPTFETVNTDLVSDTSPQLGGNLDVNTKNIVFGDSATSSDDRLTFGVGNDLQIYHDSNDSYIDDVGSGNLLIRGSVVQINKENSAEVMAKFTQDGAVELYHDNSKKFETTSTGVSVTGNIAVTGVVDGVDLAALSSTVSGKLSNVVDDTTPQLGGNLDCNNKVVTLNDSTGSDNNRFKIGNAGDLQIYHDGSHSYLDNIGTGDLKIRSTQANGDVNIVCSDSNGGFTVKSTTDEIMINSVANGAVELYHNNVKKFETTADGVNLAGNVLAFQGQSNRLIKFRPGDNDMIYEMDAGDFYRQNIGSSTHEFFVGNVERLRISDDTNGRYLGRTPLNPAESAEEIKNNVSGTPDNDWYYIKQFGNVARLHYCVFKDKNGSDIAGGPWTMNWIAGVLPNQFTSNGPASITRYLNLCKGIGIDKPGRGMESSRTTSEVYGAWLAVKRALWELDPGFFNGASAAAGGVLIMPILNVNGDGGTSDHRLIYSSGTSTHIPPNQDGDHCNANQLFCGWWGGNDFSSWATDDNNVPSPEDWGVNDAQHTGALGARSNSTAQKPSWKDLMLVTCVYK